MNEKQLQASIVMDYSQNMPEYRGTLWSTRNTTFSQRDGQSQKAMGMVAGVSDLILFLDGRFVGIEIKVKGKPHAAKHIQQQLRWGDAIIHEGGEWYIVTSKEEFWMVINKEQPPYTPEAVKQLLNNGRSTIKF